MLAMADEKPKEGVETENNGRVHWKVAGQDGSVVNNEEAEAGEMAQWLRALPAPPKVLSSSPGNNMVAHSHL